MFGVIYSIGPLIDGLTGDMAHHWQTIAVILGAVIALGLTVRWVFKWTRQAMSELDERGY